MKGAGCAQCHTDKGRLDMQQSRQGKKVRADCGCAWRHTSISAKGLSHYGLAKLACTADNIKRCKDKERQPFVTMESWTTRAEAPTSGNTMKAHKDHAPSRLHSRRKACNPGRRSMPSASVRPTSPRLRNAHAHARAHTRRVHWCALGGKAPRAVTRLGPAPEARCHTTSTVRASRL